MGDTRHKEIRFKYTDSPPSVCVGSRELFSFCSQVKSWRLTPGYRSTALCIRFDSSPVESSVLFLSELCIQTHLRTVSCSSIPLELTMLLVAEMNRFSVEPAQINAYWENQIELREQ